MQILCPNLSKNFFTRGQVRAHARARLYLAVFVILGSGISPKIRGREVGGLLQACKTGKKTRRYIKSGIKLPILSEKDVISPGCGR